MDFENRIVARYDDIFRLVDGRWLFERRTRGRRAVPRGRAADVGHGDGPQQRDDAPGPATRSGPAMTVDLAALIDPAAAADEDRRGLRVHRGARLGPAPRTACSSATSPATRAGAGRAQSGCELDLCPTFKGNGMAFENDGPPARLRARLELSRALPRRAARARRPPLRGHVPQQPERRRDARERRQHLLHRPRLRPLERLDRPGADPERRAASTALFRVPPGGGELELVVAEDEFDQPNGLCFSPDEKLLYVNDSGNLRSRSSTSPPTARSVPRA